MKHITFNEYIAKVAEAFNNPINDDLRLGQLYLQVLAHEGYSTLIPMLIDTNKDPFYLDRNLDEFCAWLESYFSWLNHAHSSFNSAQ